MSDWQPIDTAPKDRTFVLLGVRGGEVCIGFWNGVAWDDGDFNNHMTGFTHWMPLPEPPQ